MPSQPLAPEVSAVLARLSWRQKAALTVGQGFWRVRADRAAGVRGLVLADGPHGLRLQPAHCDGATPPQATCFPTSSVVAATWDVEQARRVGEAIGVEARSAGVDVVLGPGVNVTRNPLGGRNFEYFSEDPLLTSAMAVGWISGLQSTGVSACVKHFAVNGQEHRRYSIDAVVDERALREIYLPAFEAAVREAGVASVMSSYNRVNGLHAGENPRLLTDILRREWGFAGAVISDWGAVNDRLASLRAGLDLQMPEDGADRILQTVAAVRNGHLDEAHLDRAAGRVLALMAGASEKGPAPDLAAHHHLAVEIAADGVTLLRNEARTLPIPSSASSVAVIGALAHQPRFQGAGSSQVPASRVDALAPCLEELLDVHTQVTVCAGYAVDAPVDAPADRRLLAEAADAARASQWAVVVVGLPPQGETEGLDRTHLRLPRAHDELVSAVAEVCEQVVVVVVSGAPVELPWREQVQAILYAGLGGQGSGRAVASIIAGQRSPGGRLAQTWPIALSQAAPGAAPSGPRSDEHVDSIYVGYRWYDTAASEVAYPFGHGLSFSPTQWSAFWVSPAILPGGDTAAPGITVGAIITNPSARPTSEVVQVYAAKLDGGVPRPAQVLVGFVKVRLDGHESRPVEVAVPRRALAHWSVDESAFVVEDGMWELRVARSSREVEARLPVATTGGVPAGPGGQHTAYEMDSRGRFSRERFAQLMGRPLRDNVPDLPGEFTVNTPLADLTVTPLGRRVHALVSSMVMREAAADGTQLAGAPDDLADEVVPRMMLVSGLVTPEFVQALVDALNGQWSASARRAVAGLPMLLVRASRALLRR